MSWPRAVPAAIATGSLVLACAVGAQPAASAAADNGAAAKAYVAAYAAAEHKQIQQERAAAEAAFRKAEAECRTRFVVSSCVAEAQAQRRAALNELRHRELVLEEARRRAEAEDASRRLQDRQTEAASRPPPVPRAASEPSRPSAAAVAASVPGRTEFLRSRPKTADDAETAAARVAAQQRRASEAAAHRLEVEQRNAERDARGKKSTPLPVPSAASVAETASAVGR